MTLSNQVIKDFDSAVAALDDLSSMASRWKASKLTRAERNTILARVYSVSLSKPDKERLKEHIAAHRKAEGANRSYTFKKTSDYSIMLRYVFPSVEDRANISRWAGALNHLSRIGVPPDSFKEGLKSHGPLMTLYWKDREHLTRKQKRQTLTLNRPIEVSSGQTITLKLRVDEKMIFEVLGHEILDSKEEDTILGRSFVKKSF